MKLYTKTGDKGNTSFLGCGTVCKDNPCIETLGSLDELNCVIGVTLCFIEDKPLRKILNKIQNDLFTLGADLAGNQLNPNAIPRIKKEHITELEEVIDELDAKLGMPKKFILPGGTIASSFLHLCRSITRRAERSLVSSSKSIKLSPEILQYVNRLSDFLYILARNMNKEMEIKEQQPIYKYFKEGHKNDSSNIDIGDNNVDKDNNSVS